MSNSTKNEGIIRLMILLMILFLVVLDTHSTTPMVPISVKF